MHAYAIEQADRRLHELRSEGWQDLGLGAATFALSLVATQLAPPLAVPLFAGGAASWALGVRAMWRRWDLVDRLAHEPDAYVIPEVLAYASRDASLSRRRAFAALIRTDARAVEADAPEACVGMLALADELENEDLVLEAAHAMALARLLNDPEESPFINHDLPAWELEDRIRHIRSGFKQREHAE